MYIAIALTFASAGLLDFRCEPRARVGRWQHARHAQKRVCVVASADAAPAEASAEMIAAPIAARVLEMQSSWRSPGRLLVGIVGVPGSGKSSVARATASVIGSGCAVVSMDGFHYSREELNTFPNVKEAHARRGAPFTFNVSGFLRMLRELSAGDNVRVPVFDHAKKDPSEGSILNSSVNTVIVEGNYLLIDDEEWRHVRDVLKETWFLDVPVDMAMSRVRARHMSELGLDKEQARARVDGNDRVNAILVENSKTRAHFIVDHCANVSRYR